jgi:LPS export ABC transporter protein LptC
MKLAILLLAVLATACGRGVSTEPTGEGYTDLNADQIMIQASHTQYSNGVRSAEGVYDTVFIFRDSAVYHLRGVNTKMYDVDGRQSATIVADSGVLNQATDAMIAQGNVVLVTQNNCTIKSEELHYDPETRRIWSDVATRFEVGGKVTTARKFNADDGFNQVTAEGLSGAFPTGCRKPPPS